MFHKTALLVLLLAISSARAWFSCGEVEYCTRIRNNNPGDKFNLNNLAANGTGVTAQLVNSQSGKSFNFVLVALADDTFRVKINDPNYPRHEVGGTLDGEPQQVSISSQQTSNGLDVTAGNAKASIQSSPFRITFYNGNNVVGIVNNDGLLEFEEEEPNVAVALDVWFQNAQQVYGLPTHADNLALRNTGPNVNEPYRYYNIDHAAFDAYITQSLYGTIPVIYSHSTTLSSGFFWHNSAQTFVDINKQDSGIRAHFFSESGAIDFFVLTGPTLKKSVHQYAALTGMCFAKFSNCLSSFCFQGKFYLTFKTTNTVNFKYYLILFKCVLINQNSRVM